MKKIISITALFLMQTFFLASCYEYKNKVPPVNSAPNVGQEMLSADYWIKKARKPDKLLLNEEQIKDLNSHIRSAILEKYGTYTMDFPEVPDSLTEKKLENFCVAYFKKPKDPCYQNGKKLDKDFFKDIIKNANKDNLKKYRKRYGVAVKNTQLYILPTEEPYSDQKSDLETNYNCNSRLLNISKDQEWYLGFSKFAPGWVKADDIAVFKTKEQALEYDKQEDFLLVAANKMYLDSHFEDDEASHLELAMGTKLYLPKEGEAPDLTGGRPAYNNYVVKIPGRTESGFYKEKYALVPQHADVSLGYLPYTVSNILAQSFKTLGDRYGWGGQAGNRDCSSLVMDVYRCFGFLLPRNSKSLTFMDCKSFIWDENTSEKQRLKDLKKAQPGSIITMPGHVVLYIGMEKNVPYCINASWAYYESDGTEHLWRTVVVNPLDLCRSNKKTWLENSTFVKTVLPL